MLTLDRKRPFTLTGNFLIYLFTVLLLVLGGMNFLIHQENKIQLTRALERRAEAHLISLTTIGAPLIDAFDLEILATLQKEVSRNNGILFIQFLGPDGTPLIKGEPPPPGTPHRLFTHPIRQGATTLGSIRLGLDVSHLEEAIQHSFAYTLGAFLIAITMLGGLLFSFFRSHVVQQLEESESTRRAAEKEHEFLEGIMNAAGALVTVTDREGVIQRTNRLFETTLELSPQQIQGASLTDLFMEVKNETCLPAVFSRLKEGDSSRQECVVQTEHPGGPILQWNFTPVKDLAGTPNMVIGVGSDITLRKKVESELLLAVSVFENAGEAILITDRFGRIIDANPAYTAKTGFTRDEILGTAPQVHREDQKDPDFLKKILISLLESDQWSGELWARRKSGTRFPIYFKINVVKDDQGEAAYYVASFTDISDLKISEQQLEDLAYNDMLTGLPNRLLFHNRLEQEITQARRRRSKFAVLFIDLDRFKHVNDTLGHLTGDKLLVEVAQRLRDCVRGADTVARLGGDEFTVILTDIEEEKFVAQVAQKIVDSIREVVTVEGHEIFIGASIGIGIFPADGDDFKTLAKNADAAMYKAKEKGKDGFQFYETEMNAMAAERLALEVKLRKALENGEFLLHFQPKVDLRTGRVMGVESLIRWNDPETGLVPPFKFIPLAEEIGLIVPLGRWILREACRRGKAWLDAGYDLQVGVNLSAGQLDQKDIETVVSEALESSGLPPSRLDLEITESMLMSDETQAIETLGRLRAMDLTLSMDDFGTGYSSLSYLKRFPIHTLKIDRSFVRDLSENSDDAAIVAAIISMSHSLNLKVVAEGVETEAQLAFLKNLDCELMQGYLFSPPLPEEKLLELLQEKKRL